MSATESLEFRHPFGISTTQWSAGALYITRIWLLNITGNTGTEQASSGLARSISKQLKVRFGLSKDLVTSYLSVSDLHSLFLSLCRFLFISQQVLAVGCGLWAVFWLLVYLHNSVQTLIMMYNLVSFSLLF
jgi:hypothetical protein